MMLARNFDSRIILTTFCILTILFPVFSIIAYTSAQAIPRNEIVWIGECTGAAAPSGWNPLLPEISWGVHLMYCTLFLYNSRDNVWIPYLASGYKWVNEKTLDVYIRPEATWWDGEPVTAEDVKYTFDLGKKYTTTWSGYWDYLDKVEVVGPRTVRFVLKKINYFQLFAALHSVFILPKHRFEELEAKLGAKITEFKDDDPSKIIGCGPYRLMMWAADHWIFERVDNWWGKDIFGLPRPKYIGRIEYKDNTASALAFEEGKHDASTDFYPAIWEYWTKKHLARSTYFKKPPYFLLGGPIVLLITYAKYPLNDTTVRRAIAYAIPYDDIISKAYFNYSVRASPTLIVHIYPTYAKWINETLVKKYGYDYNLEMAKKILDDAGIIDRDGDGIREMPDGTKLGPFTISVPYGWTDWMMACKLIADNLKKIGIDVSTYFPDYTVWWQNIITGKFDMVLMWTADPGFDHPWNVFRVVMDDRLTGPVGQVYPSGDYERYHNPEVAKLLDEAAATTNETELAKIYSKLEEIALKDLPAIPLFYGAVWYEYSEEYWVGWPNDENRAWFSTASLWGGTCDSIPVYWCIAPKGETPTIPSWVRDLQFPTSKFLEDLSNTIKALKTKSFLERLNMTVNDLNQRLSKVESTVTDLSGRISGLSSDISSLKSTVNALSGLSAKVEELSGLKSKVNALIAVVVVETIVLLALIVVVLRRKPGAS